VIPRALLRKIFKQNFMLKFENKNIKVIVGQYFANDIIYENMFILLRTALK